MPRFSTLVARVLTHAGLLTLLAVLCAAQVSAAAPVVGRGLTLHILEKGSGHGIDHAEVRWNQQSWVSDDQGHIKIVLPNGAKGTVTIRAQGYESEKIKASDLAKLSAKTIYLFPAMGESDEANTVTITGQRQDSGTNAVSGDEARDLAGSGDPSKIVRSMAGVSVANKGPAAGRGRQAGAGGRGGPAGRGGPGGRGGFPGGGPGGGGRGGPGGASRGGFTGGPPPGGFAGGPPPGGFTGGPPPGGFSGAPGGGGTAGNFSGAAPGGAPGAAAGAGGGGFGGGAGGARGGGVGEQSSASAGIVIRGSAPADSLYLVDDIAVPYLFHDIEDLAIIPALMIHEVELNPGGFGARYGNVTGGVLRLLTPDQIPEHSTTEFTLNLPYYSGIVHVQAINPESAVTVAVRRSYVDYFLKDYYASLEKKNPSATNTNQTPHFADGQVQYLHKSGSASDKLTALMSEDGSQQISSSNLSTSALNNPTNTTNRFAVLAEEHKDALSAHWLLRTTPQASVLTEAADTATSSTGLRHYKGRAPTELRYADGKTDGVTIGLDPQSEFYKTRAQTTITTTTTTGDTTQATTTTNEGIHNRSLGAWVEGSKALGDVTVTPGVRAQVNHQTKQTAYDPRLTTRYAVTEIQTIRATVGRYSEAPTLVEGDSQIGRDDLHFERVTHYVLGLESKWNTSWYTEINGFYKDGREMIEPDPIDRYNNHGQLISGGGELTIKKNPTGRLFGWISYTYSKTQVRADETQHFSRASYDQKHVGSLVSGYTLTPVWKVGGIYSYHSGQQYTPSNGGIYNISSDSYSAAATPAANRDLPAWQQASLYLTKDVLFDSWKLTFKFGVEQFWFKPQTDSVSPSYDYSQDIPANSIQTVPFIEMRGTI